MFDKAKILIICIDLALSEQINEVKKIGHLYPIKGGIKKQEKFVYTVKNPYAPMKIVIHKCILVANKIFILDDVFHSVK